MESALQLQSRFGTALTFFKDTTVGTVRLDAHLATAINIFSHEGTVEAYGHELKALPKFIDVVSFKLQNLFTDCI